MADTDKPKRRYAKTKASKATAWAANEAERAKTGRPREVTEVVFAELCRRIAGGRTLADVCRDADMPDASTVRERAADSPEFSLSLARARRLWSDATADEIVEIIDDSSNDAMEVTFGGKTTIKANREFIDRSKARVDVRKWLMQRFSKQIYSDDATKIDPASPADAAELIKQDQTVISPDTDDLPAKPVL